MVFQNYRDTSDFAPHFSNCLSDNIVAKLREYVEFKSIVNQVKIQKNWRQGRANI